MPFYEEWQVRGLQTGWRMEVAGSVSQKGSWTITALRTLASGEQITQANLHRGMEARLDRSGVPCERILQRSEPTLHARM